MKSLSPFLFVTIAFALLSSSCIKNVLHPGQQSAQLPGATQSGLNTFGCRINGQVLATNNNSLFGPTRVTCKYEYGPFAPPYFYLSGISKPSSSPDGFITIETDSLVFAEGDVIKLTTYQTPDKASASFERGGGGHGEQFYQTNEMATGELHITKLDSVKRILSGTFFFKAVNYIGDTLKVTDGRFDTKF